MTEGMPITQQLNQLLFVEIDFDDEIRALILLTSLSNSWEAMRMAVSNSTGKAKLKYDDIRDLVLAEEVRRKDSGELLGSGSALNVDYRGRSNNRDYKGSNRIDQNSETEIRVGHTRDKVCVGIVKSLGTSRRIAEIQRQKRIILQTL